MAKIETRSIEDLLPDPRNLNKHTQKGHGLVENSIRRRGIGRGILAAGKNTKKPVIMAGNLTHEKARDAGIDEVIFVHTTGNQLVVTVRDDLDPTSPEAIALGIEDNESQKQSYNPEIDILAAVMADPAMQALKAEDKVLADIVSGMGYEIQNKKTLDELEDEYGNSEDEDFYPIIKIKVTPEIFEKYEALMTAMQGRDDMEKFDALISRVELS